MDLELECDRPLLPTYLATELSIARGVRSETWTMWRVLIVSDVDRSIDFFSFMTVCFQYGWCQDPGNISPGYSYVLASFFLQYLSVMSNPYC